MSWFVILMESTREEEAWFILEGTFAFQIGEGTFEVKPGSFVLAPRGTVHSFWATGPQPHRWLTIFSPSGMEGYFRDQRRVRFLSAVGWQEGERATLEREHIPEGALVKREQPSCPKAVCQNDERSVSQAYGNIAVLSSKIQGCANGFASHKSGFYRPTASRTRRAISTRVPRHRGGSTCSRPAVARRRC